MYRIELKLNFAFLSLTTLFLYNTPGLKKFISVFFFQKWFFRRK